MRVTAYYFLPCNKPCNQKFDSIIGGNTKIYSNVWCSFWESNLPKLNETCLPAKAFPTCHHFQFGNGENCEIVA